ADRRGAQLVFFFQAEDGIRDGHVTGVQTCALPILQLVTPYVDQIKPDVALTAALAGQQQELRNITERVVARLKYPLKREGDEYRSEERRVGKEWGCRG